MKLVSINLAEKKSILWKGSAIDTGIFKKPITGKAVINKNGVVGDCVADKKYHGSLDKAVYLYSADHYDYWKKKYPTLDWNFGMLGENLTIEGLNEADYCFGETLQIGTNLVLQITQPRQPCYKLGVKFGTQKIVKDFINAPCPGLYVRVLKEGKIKTGDKVQVLEKMQGGLSVLEFWKILHQKNINRSDVEKCLNDKYLVEEAKQSFRRKIKTTAR